MTYDLGAPKARLLADSDWLHHWTQAREELERARSAPSCYARRPHLELARLHFHRLEVAADQPLDR